VVLDVCFRRVSPVAVGPGEGRFSRPITANQAQRRELVFMPKAAITAGRSIRIASTVWVRAIVGSTGSR
jgi:hypothetical protein